MGWTHSQAAGQTLARWEAACRESTGQSNTWEHKGWRYFFEVTERSLATCGIQGTIHTFVDAKSARLSGTFMISGKGVVVLAPKFLKSAGKVVK